MSNPQGESALLAALTSHLQSLQPCSQLNAVSVKLPEFWSTAPEVWFARAEAQFSIKNITQDQTKYEFVISALDIKSVEEVQGFLINLPEAEKYTNLQKNLIKAFGKSQTQRDSEPLNLIGLGDRKPTALLRKINSLNDDPATLKRALFLSKLPAMYVVFLLAKSSRIWKHLPRLQTESGRYIVQAGQGYNKLPRRVLRLPLLQFRRSKKQINFHQNALEIDLRRQPVPQQCVFITKDLARNCQGGCKLSSLLSGNDKSQPLGVAAAGTALHSNTLSVF